MLGEWKAPATSSGSARLPRSRAASSAFSSASRLPERTTWPGALSLATVTPASAATASASWRSAPTSASIEPESSASAISLPRRTTRFERVVALEHAGGGERGELAERVAGGGRGVEIERVPAGEAGAEDGGLLEAGRLAGAREGILTHERCAALEQLGRALRDEVSHVGCLAALAREKRDRGRRVDGQAHT